MAPKVRLRKSIIVKKSQEKKVVKKGNLNLKKGFSYKFKNKKITKK